MINFKLRSMDILIVILSLLGFVRGMKESIYVIQSTIPEDGTEMTMTMEAMPAGSETELGEVVTSQFSSDNSATHWEVKKIGSVYSLTSQENSRNFVTESDERHGFRFKPAENGTEVIERVVGRKPVQCLKNNGQGKVVTFIYCKDQELIFPLSPFLWKFNPISDDDTTSRNSAH